MLSVFLMEVMELRGRKAIPGPNSSTYIGSITASRWPIHQGSSMQRALLRRGQRQTKAFDRLVLILKNKRVLWVWKKRTVSWHLTLNAIQVLGGSNVIYKSTILSQSKMSSIRLKLENATGHF